jgi:hypothetical protein
MSASRAEAEVAGSVDREIAVSERIGDERALLREALQRFEQLALLVLYPRV